MADTTNISAEVEEVKQEALAVGQETAAAGQEAPAAEKQKVTDFEKKKKEKKKSGNYTHNFKEPVEIMGKTCSAITFYFDRLTGEDIEAIEDELMDQNKYVLTPETSSPFQCILAAKAAGVPSDEIRRLPVHEYMKIKNAARNFLINAG